MPNLEIQAPDGRLDAYLARPPLGDGPWPTVVVVHDIFGLTDMARAHADHLAAAGYLTVAPDLYTRGGVVRCVKSTFASLAAGEGPAIRDIDAIRSWARDRDDTTDRTGVIGFCMGGGFALVTASRGWDAAAPNYGPLPKDLAVLDGACPVVASYGGRDRGLPGAAKTIEAALTERGIAHDVTEYPSAGHSFMDRLNAGPFTPLLKVAGLAYDQPSAEDAWGRILRFFDQYLRQ